MCYSTTPAITLLKWSVRLQFVLTSEDDLKNHRKFLKRCDASSLKVAQLYVGSTVTVYSRQLHVLDFADEYTRGKLGSRQERTYGMVKPNAIKNMGKIMDMAIKDGFRIARCRLLKLSKEETERFYGEHKGKPFFGSDIRRCLLISAGTLHLSCVLVRSLRWNSLPMVQSRSGGSSLVLLHPMR
jgi:hypothetical protein